MNTHLRDIRDEAVVAVFSNEFEELTRYFASLCTNLDRGVRYLLFCSNVSRVNQLRLRRKLGEISNVPVEAQKKVIHIVPPKGLLAVSGHQAVIVGSGRSFGTLKRKYDVGRSKSFVEIPRDQVEAIKSQIVEPVVRRVSTVAVTEPLERFNLNWEVLENG